ncbi:MAG: DEAD/DEAH box helicase [Lysobacterales bacterium]
MSTAELDTGTFRDLGLPESLLTTLATVGYESPSPIQAATIPQLLAGRDVVGQAQTGTGKTAAFALPILARLTPGSRKPQAMVLTPTRELAIQVAEAFQRYAHDLPHFQVLPIYGGQSYGPQLAALKRGVQVVVGTPGRLLDHLDRRSLDLSELKYLVLDEADEMLRMGFIDDVEKILAATPAGRQIALFSATMPAPIRRIAKTHLKDPAEVTITSKTSTLISTRQRYWMVSGVHKLDALTRILEAEPFDAMIVFARTKQATEELAEKLSARGFNAAAINGDLAQAQRERAIARLRDGQLDILVATDVAARGLDVERITHVLNYDIPYDTESYVHRIGRTGRAGRSGEAILFVAPRERGMLHAIERATRQPITPMELPSVDKVNDRRMEKFRGRIDAALSGDAQDMFRQLIEDYERERNVPAIEIAAALARALQGDEPLLLKADPPPRTHVTREYPTREFGSRARNDAGRPTRFERPADSNRAPRFERSTESPERAPRFERTTESSERAPRFERPSEPKPHFEKMGTGDSVERAPRTARPNDSDKETYRLAVGREHGVLPKHIVGAIANEAGLDAQHIGRIEIEESTTLVDLPRGMPEDLVSHLKSVRVCGKPLRIERFDPSRGAQAARTDAKPRTFAPRGDGAPKRPFKPRPAR